MIIGFGKGDVATMGMMFHFGPSFKWVRMTMTIDDGQRAPSHADRCHLLPRNFVRDSD